MQQGVQLGGDLDPGGPAAYDDKRQVRIRDLGTGEGALLVAFDHAVAYLLGSSDALYVYGVLLDTWYATVPQLGPEGHYQVVVRKFSPVGDYLLVLGIDALHLGAAEAGAVPDQDLVGKIPVRRALPRLVPRPRTREHDPPQCLDTKSPATGGERPFHPTVHSVLPGIRRQHFRTFVTPVPYQHFSISAKKHPTCRSCER